MSSEPLLNALPYGVAVCGLDQVVSTRNRTAGVLLPEAAAGAPRCYELFRCDRPGDPCEQGCVGLRAAQAHAPLPEVRLNPRHRDRAELYVTCAPLDSPDGALLLLRAAPADDERPGAPDDAVARPHLHIQAFGRTVVRSNCGELSGQWLSERPGQVLKYLVCRRSSGARADELAEAVCRETSRRCWATCSSPGARRGAPSDDRADRRRPHHDHRNTAGVSRVGRVAGNDLPSPTATRAAAGAAEGAVAAGTV